MKKSLLNLAMIAVAFAVPVVPAFAQAKAVAAPTAVATPATPATAKAVPFAAPTAVATPATPATAKAVPFAACSSVADATTGLTECELLRLANYNLQAAPLQEKLAALKQKFGETIASIQAEHPGLKYEAPSAQYPSGRLVDPAKAALDQAANRALMQARRAAATTTPATTTTTAPTK